MKDSNLVSKFKLTDIPPAPCGIPQTEVTFEMDVNGILKVSAQGNMSRYATYQGKSESIVIGRSRKGCLSQQEIEHKVAEAERFQVNNEACIEALNLLSDCSSMASRGSLVTKTVFVENSARIT